MPKFQSKSLRIEAHVVSDDEKTLQAKVGSGTEYLVTGDALVTLESGKQFKVPGPLFDALFERETEHRSGATSPEGGFKGRDKGPE